MLVMEYIALFKHMLYRYERDSDIYKALDVGEIKYILWLSKWINVVHV